jgi:glycosyltransferase involved in cell wall biosynthesis
VISARRFVAADRVYFLVSDIGDGYGISRSVVTLANRLAESRRVEIVSLRRTRRPVFRLDDRVALTYLDRGRPSGPDDEIRGWRRYLLRRTLGSRPPGVLISTEPRLHAVASRDAPRHLITIAYDHRSVLARRPTDRLRLAVTSGRTPDALVALTEPDGDAYRRALLATASVFALASRHDGLPMVFLEAMSKGLPLVSFDVSSGSAQLVEDGVNGWLVDDGDVSGFSTALFELIKDGDLRLRMGAASQAKAHQYDIGRIAAQWEELFARLSHCAARR